VSDCVSLLMLAKLGSVRVSKLANVSVVR
jgi:hypothetical protein